MLEDYNHIRIEVPESMPAILIERVVEDLITDGLKLKVLKRPDLGAMCALEWMIPTALTAFVLKSYFEGFLNEAGKDHYEILKNWLKKFTYNGRKIKIQTIYATESTDKQQKNNTQSKSVSLLLETKNGKIIKLLFDDDLDKEDWDSAINQLLDFAIENYEKHPSDDLTKELEQFDTDTSHIVYAIINKQNKKLCFFDAGDLSLFQSQNIEKNNELPLNKLRSTNKF